MTIFTLLMFVELMITIEFQNAKEVLIAISQFLVFIIMTLGTLGMQTLVYVICQTMSCIYEEIHENISVQAENLCSKTISTWKVMLLTMQNQLREIGDWLSPNEAIYAVAKVLNISTSLYTLLAVFSDPSRIFLNASFVGNNTEALTGESVDDPWTAVFQQSTPGILFSISAITIFFSMLQLSLLVLYAEKITKSVSFPT